jgi:hypothetical protein
MSRPKEICIEDLTQPAAAEPYIRCVALVGSVPGLALDRHGSVRWRTSDPACYGLWVSADDRLVLLRGLRGENVGPITVARGGRRLEAPASKPVILVDQDLLELDGRQLRVHIHGDAQEIHPPTPVKTGLGRLARATAAALAIGAVVGGGAGSAAGDAIGPPPIEVRQEPPSVAAPRPVLCKITAMKPGKVLVIHATCPKDTILPVGTPGELLDAKNAPLQKGGVRITAVKGMTVVAEAAELQKPVKARTLRFHVH